MVAPFPPEPERLRAAREALPASRAGILLNTARAGPLPAETARAMGELADQELRLGRSDGPSVEAFRERLDEAAAVLAAVIGGAPEQVELTHGPIDGLERALALTLETGRGQSLGKVVTTDQERDGLVALGAWCRRNRHELVALPAEGGDDRRLLAELRTCLTAGEVRAVVVSHVVPTTGRLLPVAEIARQARRSGAVTIVEGSLAVGAIPVLVAELGLDAYVFGGQAWLLGPQGTGGLWLARGEIRRPGGSERSPEDGAWRGEFYRPAVVGLARSAGWLAMYVGLAWVFERGARLAAALATRLAEVPNVEVLTPGPAMATTIAFRVGGWSGEQVLTALEDRTFAIAEAIGPLAAVRLSVGFFNTEEELDRTVACVREIAAHGPEGLPPRPRLTIVHEGAGSPTGRS
jgi:L-cysteine/cystine lyase